MKFQIIYKDNQIVKGKLNPKDGFDNNLRHLKTLLAAHSVKSVQIVGTTNPNYLKMNAYLIK